MRYYPACFSTLLLGALAACSSPAAEQPVAAEAPVAAGAPVPRPAAAPAVRTSYAYTLPPIDQTADYPALQEFVRRVLAACAARRQADLLALVSDSVVVSYGGGVSGKAGFVSDFLNGGWHGYEQLQAAIRLGGTVQRDSAGHLTATYPYFQDCRRFERDPMLATLDLDPFTTYVGLRPNVAVYQRPDSASPLLARLAYPLLLNGAELPELPGGWMPVLAADSSFRGYARARQLFCLARPTVLIETHGRSFRIVGVAPFD